MSELGKDMRSNANTPGNAALPQIPRERSAIPRIVTSEQLLQGALELHILHEGATYRLRLTQHGKLILCK
jgi:hemin uptake protein HemP